MPRLPTILVIGSQFISTTPASSTVVIAHSPCSWARPLSRGRRRPMSPGLLVASQQFVTLHAPLGLVVEGLRGEAAERLDDRPVEAARGGGDLRARGLVHERHELVGEA